MASLAIWRASASERPSTKTLGNSATVAVTWPVLTAPEALAIETDAAAA